MAPISNKPRDGSKTFRVLLTGFGPFGDHPVDNPSWVAASFLGDETIPHPFREDYQIHITAIQIPTSYESILTIVPLLHARPPLVPSSKTNLGPPEQGYDFIMHCGAGPRDLIRLERVGHKTGYKIPDNFGVFAPPAMGVGASDGSAESKDERFERERWEKAKEKMSDKVRWRMPEIGGPIRGFGEGYESAPLEVSNDRLDLYELERYLRSEGVSPLVVSNDAGRYCCDYMTYCSMYQSQQTSKRSGDGSPVLFMHIPPFGKVYSRERVTTVIRSAIEWACAYATVS